MPAPGGQAVIAHDGCINVFAHVGGLVLKLWGWKQAGMGTGRGRHNLVALVVCAAPNNIDVVSALCCFLLCGRTNRSVLRQKNLYVNFSFRYQI